MTDPPDLKQARQTKLHASSQALLYDIAKRVRSGYHWWLTGEVETSKILALIAKFDSLYQTSADSATRHRRKKSGDASSTLIVWPLRNDPAGYTTRFGFILLSTEHLDAQVMYDARKKPVRCNFYAGSNAVFHLIPSQVKVKKVTRPAGRKPKEARSEPAAKEVIQTVFEWRLSAKSLDLMRQRYRAAIDSPSQLDQLRAAYSSLPMVSGYRHQFKTVLQEAKKLWKKATTPQVQAAKLAIRDGTRADPFSIQNLPFIRGFPKMYDSPAVTVSAYLEANKKTQKAVEKRNENRVVSDHAGPQIPAPETPKEGPEISQEQTQ